MWRDAFEETGTDRDDSPSWVVLVDENDVALGRAEKLECHRRGALHRAISVNVSDPQGRVLLQRRALHKYHSGGSWSNACCSHPAPDEDPLAAAYRRTEEELGFRCDLRFDRIIRYRSDVGGGLVENELVHFFTGTYEGPVRPDPEEVGEHAWVTRGELDARLRDDPESFSPWFRIYAEGGAIYGSSPGG